MNASDIASQTGASGGLWTHTPVDWAGNEGVAKPGGWPTDAAVAVPPNGATPSSLALMPIITAISASAITATTATINWTVQPSSSSQVEYGPTTAYGTTRPVSPIVGAGAQSQGLTGLTTSTVYHYRVRVFGAGGTVYSADRIFTTL